MDGAERVAEVAGGEPSPGADVGGGEPSPSADVSGGEPSPGADVAGASPLPVQMWQGRAQSRRRCGGERAQCEYALPPFQLSATNHDRAALGAHEIRVLPRGGVKHVVREDERHLPPRAGTQHAARAMQYGT
jgi:hypothetical protein